jgi:hypothetical protein
MHRYFEYTLELMDQVQKKFEEAMPNPEFVKMSYGHVLRFKEKNIYEALLQKLAHVQSATRAAYVLWENGHYQEQFILHRVIDETNEDITFLVLGINNGLTDRHNQYLEAFWEEEFDESGDPLSSEQRRPMVPRQKIRAYIANNDGVGNPSRGIEVTRTISKAYSGFVHGASPQIMNMYGGNPSHFHTKGMVGTPREEEALSDLWNYIYRTFISYILFSKIIGAEEHVESLTEWKNEFEKSRGANYGS